jgi:hypothetical protein
MARAVLIILDTKKGVKPKDSDKNKKSLILFKSIV